MMNIGLKQTISQQQKLIMTPKLQQAIKVLMMSRLDLTQYLSQQLEQNPLLEEVLDEEMEIEELRGTEELDPDTQWNEPEEIVDREDKEPDIEWENCFDDMISLSEKAAFEHWDAGDQPQADLAQPESLHDFLMRQLYVTPLSETERKIGEQIIGNLDENGRLKVTPLFHIDLKFQSDLEGERLSEQLRKNLEKRLYPEFDNEVSLFTSSVELNSQSDLDNDEIPEDLREEFDTHDNPLSPDALVTKKKGGEWLIRDASRQRTYAVRKEEGEFHVYEILPSPCFTVSTKEEGHKWLITDGSNQQTYTIINEDDQLNVYSITLEDIAAEVGCGVDEVEDVLEFIQNNFEPIGIAYRTIPETLLIQMRAAQIHNPLAEEIVKNHFEDLLNNHLPRIAQELNVGIEDVEEVRQIISPLDPYPGRHFSDPTDPRRPNTIIPDVTIEKEADGSYRVRTNEDGMPLLRLNPAYIDWMVNGHKHLDDKAKEWLENRKSQAIDILKSIGQRRQTIAKVTEAIFNVQSDFLEHGVNGLKPLVLKQIADMAGVHESTVSRVTSNKYVETPQGIYPLKHFFSGELPTDSGSNVSVTTVKEKIKKMIEKENPAKPLSDRKIADILKAQGIRVARRTVAKYREELDILPSSKRKRQWES